MPDVAYVARGRLASLGADAREMAPFAPDVALEIRSPRTVIAHDAGGIRSFVDGDRFEHAAVPGLAFDVGALFDTARVL